MLRCLIKRKPHKLWPLNYAACFRIFSVTHASVSRCCHFALDPLYGSIAEANHLCDTIDAVALRKRPCDECHLGSEIPMHLAIGVTSRAGPFSVIQRAVLPSFRNQYSRAAVYIALFGYY